MSEVVGTFLSAEQRNERANRPEETRNSPRGDFAQQRFEFAVRQFDRVEVRRILRQIAKRCPSTFDCLLGASNFVRWKVVHHHDIAAPERRNQALFHVGQEHFSIHGAVDHHGRRHFIVTQGGHEGNRLPCPKRHLADQSDAPRCSAAEAHQVGTDRGLVDKYQPGGIKQALLPNPTSARASDVRALPFSGLQCFFLK